MGVGPRCSLCWRQTLCCLSAEWQASWVCKPPGIDPPGSTSCHSRGALTYRCFCYVSGCYCGCSRFKLRKACTHFYFCPQPFPPPFPPFVRQDLRIPPWPRTLCVARRILNFWSPSLHPPSPGITGEHSVPESEVFILLDVQIVSFGAGRSHVGFSSPIDPAHLRLTLTSSFLLNASQHFLISSQS